MSIPKNNKDFVYIKNSRDDLYRLYKESINTFDVYNKSNDNIEKILLELTSINYDLNNRNEVKSAISFLHKIRNSKKQELTLMSNLIKDYKVEYNKIISALISLRCIESIRYGRGADEMIDVIKYELDESNPDINAMKSLRIGEIKLINILYELNSNRVKLEFMFKIIKMLINKLNNFNNN